MEVQEARDAIDRVVNNICLVIKGKENQIRQALTCWLAGGHILFEDVPGTGKTILARAMAASIGTGTKRVQFTPDLLPSDIIGSAIYSRETSQFRFNPGPIFTNVLLADEINRATPRTQSALLQAMAERQVTAENNTHDLPENFFVIATQNPVEQHGTFPLPEAQLDRFMMRLGLGYPFPDTEVEIVQSQLLGHPIEKIGAVISEDDWNKIRRLAREVKVARNAIQYATMLVNGTRNHAYIALGASPRATIALIRCAQAYSLMYGFSFVKPDFIKSLASNILDHRIVLTTRARLDRIDPKEVLAQVISKIQVPVRAA